MNVFTEKGLEVAERILGLIDRDENSDTFGCSDRNYWHYRVTDFPSCWFQLSSEYVAKLYFFDRFALSSLFHLRCF